MFRVNPRELCNVIYALLTADFDVDERARFDIALNNPRGLQIATELSQMGVA